MGIQPAPSRLIVDLWRTKEPKVCAGYLLKSPLNLTDYFLPGISAKLSIPFRVSFDLFNDLKSKI
jgi:hypothetical protein